MPADEVDEGEHAARLRVAAESHDGREADACEDELVARGIAFEQVEPEGRVLRPRSPSRSRRHHIHGRVLEAPGIRLPARARAPSFGPQLFDLGVREVRFGSAFRWSKVRVGGKTKNVLSRHALGIAMDIVSFVDADGVDHNVKHDYKAGDDLLHQIEQTVNASGQFGLLLTPKNDPKSHSDHFHLEANPDYTAEPPPRPAS